MQPFSGQPIGPYVAQTPFGAQATFYTQTPYGSYVPLAPPATVPFPAGFGGEREPYEPPPIRPPLAVHRTRSRKHSRSASQNENKELKGILKPPREGGPSSVGHGEKLTRANSQRARANSSTRPGLDVLPPFMPEHLFLALHGPNEVKIEGIAYQSTIEDLREHVLPLWYRGVVMEEGKGHSWRAQFGGNPWTSSGMDLLYARRLLCRLFAVLAHNGYKYLSTVNVSTPPCRLLFSMIEPPPPEIRLYFFSVCISASGDKISIVDAPDMTAQQLGRNLRSVFPNKIASDRFEEDRVYIIEVKKGLMSLEIDRTLLAAYILQFFKTVGYELSGSLPLGRSSLTLGSRKEVWMFRAQFPMDR